MKIADLLSRGKGGSAAIREAIGRAEEAGRVAADKLEELARQRAEALLADDERALDRLEALLARTQRDADRADLAIVELTRRLSEAEAAERQAALDATHERGLAAARKAAGLIQKDYARLATQLRDLVVELKRLDEEVAAVNAELLKAGDRRQVEDGESIARPDNGLVRIGGAPIWRTICLPSPGVRSERLYPETDLWGTALELAA